MPFIQMDDEQFPLRVGELRVGTGGGADIRLARLAAESVEPDDGGTGDTTLAVIELSDSLGAAIRRGLPDATRITVNGVALGEQPSPLFHGDKISIAGRELTYADELNSGNTQIMPTFVARDRYEPSESRAARHGHERHESASGGRLVSLVDGREYRVAEDGLRIGRDAGSDVVVPSGNVSRQHAEIMLTSAGYRLSDLSANGVLVNGSRVEKHHVLSRGDVVRIGDADFRFHEDAARTVEDEVGKAEPALPPGLDRSTEADRSVLATLEILNEGVMKGTRFEVRSPLTHLGRGPHNDVIVTDESVSDSHAKLQRRDAGWFVVDMHSTNGTYVAGQRILEECRLDGTVDLRLGGIKMSFRPAVESAEVGAATRTIVGVHGAEPRRSAACTPRAMEARLEQQIDEAPATTVPLGLWIAALVVLGATLLFVLQGR